MSSSASSLVVLALNILLTYSRCDGKSIQSQDEWFQQGQESIRASLGLTLNKNVAKNVVLFIGDGMGISTVTAARIYRGQKNGQPGEENLLNFERFPHIALSKTYNTDRQVADSAGTATAILSGVKTGMGIIGANQHTTYENCESMEGNEVDNILDWSQEKGKLTGLVTTTRLTHATPSCAYGHSPSRNWEIDYQIPSACQGKVADLSVQLVERGTDIRVIMGGGRAYFTSEDTDTDPEYPEKKGHRKDGRNLIKEWEQYHDNKSRSRYRYVWNSTEFAQVDPATTDYLLGMFEPDHMKYELDRGTDPAGEPSLAEMTEKAISMLDKTDDGFFLLVEGGRIDHAHHQCNAKRALEDTLAFEDAVQKALDMTDERETLIVVTADHSHTFTLGSYPPRGNNILGFTDELALLGMGVTDEFPVPALMYANGPGPTNRSHMAGADPTADDFLQPVAVPAVDESHGGEEVGIYARGPMAHLFNGVQEQNYIAHVMAYASCVGHNTEHCDADATATGGKSGGVKATLNVMIISILLCIVVEHHDSVG